MPTPRTESAYKSGEMGEAGMSATREDQYGQRMAVSRGYVLFFNSANVDKKPPYAAIIAYGGVCEGRKPPRN